MPMKITRECIWRKHLENEQLSKDIFLGLTENFKLKTNEKKIGLKSSDLRVIDGKSAHNLPILIRAVFEK